MTLVYFGSVVNPTGHLRGLPVGVVNQDAGASVGAQRVDVGRQPSAALVGAPAVAKRLRPTVVLMTNPRAGTLAVSLATGVLGPALSHASGQTGHELLAMVLTGLMLFAALGTVGQLVALVVFVYLALASSGGTVPLDALSGFFRFVANFEPLRQILDGVRAILYFGARGDAGLTRAWIATGLGLLFWIALGLSVTTWYDRRPLYRMPPDLMDYVDRAVLAYRTETRQSGSLQLDPADGPAPAGHDAPGHPPP
jgi:uncharacterized phage infection (PIP) family protein YhgE